MKLLIAGSRSIKTLDISPFIPEGTDFIISGGAIGVDTLAERYADVHRLSKLILRPDYASFGKGAPLVRNKTMVEIADQVLIFWDGVSRGTKFTADYAARLGKKVIMIRV